MKTTIAFLLASLAAASGTWIATQQNPAQMSKEEMEKGWKRYIEICKPGREHKFYEQMVGKWNVTVRMGEGGGETKGVSENSWAYDGRWLKCNYKGSMAGMPVDSTMIMGYDNFKKKFVFTTFDSVTTNIRPAEGSIDQSGKNIFFYGPMDEPITGENDKPVKYALRIIDHDKHIMEVHDLAIGEKNTKVMEFEFNREKK